VAGINNPVADQNKAAACRLDVFFNDFKIIL
jgi:hypothetical protein